PVNRWRPRGAPITGLPVPAVYGHKPHTCRVVPRHIEGVETSVDTPPPAPGQPRGPGSTGRGAFRFADFSARVGMVWVFLRRPSITAPSSSTGCAVHAARSDPAGERLRTRNPVRHTSAAG